MADDRAFAARAQESTTGTQADAAAAAASPALPTVSTRVWQGGAEDWYDTANWKTPDGAQNSFPLPGDEAVIARGTALLVGGEAKNNGLFDATDVVLGSSSAAPATLEAEQASLGSSFAITAKGDAQLLAQGTSTYDGHMTLDGGANLTLGAVGTGDLILARGFDLVTASKSTKADVTLAGNVTLDGVGALATPKSVSLTNDSVVSVLGLTNAGGVGIQGAIKGTGTFDLGLASDLRTAGSVSNGQTVDFTSAGAELDIGHVQGFAGSIANFGPGDILGLTNVTYSSSLAASYDAASSTLTVTDASTHRAVASIAHVSAQTGSLTVAQAPSGTGVSIGYASPPSAAVSKANIAGSDDAMNAAAARSLHVPGTSTAITGAGEKIGIISTSFDNTGTAAANAAAGYLPGVDVITDDPTGTGDDEGQAMAEEIHQVAPGAQIDFCASDDGTTSSTQQTFAQAVQALRNDHCNIIVDDIAMPAGPRYQVAGPAADAVQTAVGDGIDYFSAAGNEGQAFLNQTFTPSATKVRGLEAHQFDNRTPFERFTVAGTTSTSTQTTAYLQWGAPYENPNGGNAPQDLTLELFNKNGKYVSSSAPVTIDDPQQGASPVQVSAASLRVPLTKKAQTYYFAVVHDNGEPTPSQFNVTLLTSGSGTGAGGVIDDPQAGIGSDIVDTKLVSGVNTVGAAFYGESAAFGQQPTANEGFSSYGGETQLLYAPNGAALPSPETLGEPTFTAPDGTVTTAPGNFSDGFFGTSAAAPNAAAVAALMLQADPLLTAGQVTSILQQSAIPFGNPDQSGAGSIQADKAVEAAIADVAPVCFAAGTRIRTARGEIAVDELVVGDLVVSAAGRMRPIRWLGHRSLDGRRHPRPADIRPVRIAAHALGANRPSRDLRVSPGHAICIDVLGEVLIPAGALINGSTIVQEGADSVTYWHVELDSHDVILAENLPAESYLEMGNRGFFAEQAATALHASPDAPARTHADFCRPYLAHGPVVDAVRHRLAVRAVELASTRSDAEAA